MSSQLKISADTSAVKKSILDIGKTIKDLKGSKVQIFNSEDRKFIKSEMKKEIVLMKQKLKENRAEISRMVAEQKKMIEGSEQELEVRKKILEAYKTQAKLGRQLGQNQKAVKMGGSVDQAGGGMMSSLMTFARLLPGIAALAAVGYAVSKGAQASQQYQAGVGNRNRLKGLGVDDQSFGSPGELARVGLSEQDMIERRTEATATLGRGGTSQQGEMRKASFERAFGLEGGTMTGISTQLRGQMGGAGANDAQMKLQAQVFASGIEDAIGPYLESATQLLSAINESGQSNTAEITGLLAQMTKDGERTPEMMAKALADINSNVKGATGEQSAFLQTAFARAGIGGGTLGGTKFTMQAGGIMGQNRGELEKRGYNKELLDNMEKSGMFQGAGKRVSAIMDQMKTSGGLKPGQNVSDINNTDQMVGMGKLAGNVLGIKDPSQAFDALLMMEKVQKKQMSQKDFDSKIKQMQEGNDPAVARLDKINGTLAGQTDVLNKINTNLMEALGKEAVAVTNQATKLDNEGIAGVTDVAGAMNRTGAVEATGNAAQRAAKFTRGGAGESLYNATMGSWDNYDADQKSSDSAIVDFAKKRRDKGEGFVDKSDEEITSMVMKSLHKDLTAKDIGKEVANALQKAPIINNNNNRIQMPDGKVTDRTSK